MMALLGLLLAFLQLRGKELTVTDIRFILLDALGELVDLLHAGQLLGLLVGARVVTAWELLAQLFRVVCLVVWAHYAPDCLVGHLRPCAEGHPVGQGAAYTRYHAWFWGADGSGLLDCLG